MDDLSFRLGDHGRYPTQIMAQQHIGSQRKRDIATVITSLLDRDMRYSASSIEHLITTNVRHAVLTQRGLAADHIRRAMIENGYVIRDAKTNETWVSPDFVGISAIHAPRLEKLKNQLELDPDSKDACPECGVKLKMAALLNHYMKKHAGTEKWERIVDENFGH
jgi:hypothetical protein